MYTQFPTVNSSFPLSLMNLLPGATESEISSAEMQNQLASILMTAGLNASQPPSYLLPGSSLMPINPVSNHPAFLGVDTSTSVSLLPYLSRLQQQSPELLAAEAAASNVDAHTIVRAPVLYETAKVIKQSTPQTDSEYFQIYVELLLHTC